MQIIPITKLIMDDTCKNKNDAYQVAFYKLENFDLEKIICLNIERYNCNKYRINDLSWIKNQDLLNRPDILIMKPTTKLTEEEQQILLDLNIKVYYVNEKILFDNDLLKKAINEIERKIYKSKTLKYFEVEKQNIKNIEEKYKNLENNELEKKLIDELLNLIKDKDEVTYKHVKNVSDYVDIFVDGMPDNEKMKKEDIIFLKKACLLHDIGKLTIPNQILKKKESLTDNEYYDIKKHVSENAYLFNLKLMDDYREIALSHHERYDGKGYPRGLKKDEIPYFSRIIAVLDTFDALTGNREYVKNNGQKSLYEVLKIISENAGTQFDPKIVEYFIKGVAKNKEFQMKFSLNEGGINK